MVIGSGPIVIGQAAEFDYAGTQACLALKEEGYEVILCNTSPATIMTDPTIRSIWSRLLLSTLRKLSDMKDLTRFFPELVDRQD